MASDTVADGIIIPKPATDLRLLARQRVPIEVGAVQLGPDGALSEGDPSKPLRFAFRYRGILFAAEIKNQADNQIRLSSRLGRLPFTAENPFARRCVSRIMTAGKPHNGSFWIDEQGILRLDMTARHKGARTPVSVLQATVKLLLEARPRLLLMEGLLRPVSAPALRATDQMARAADLSSKDIQPQAAQ